MKIRKYIFKYFTGQRKSNKHIQPNKILNTAIYQSGIHFTQHLERSELTFLKKSEQLVNNELSIPYKNVDNEQIIKTKKRKVKIIEL